MRDIPARVKSLEDRLKTLGLGAPSSNPAISSSGADLAPITIGAAAEEPAGGGAVLNRAPSEAGEEGGSERGSPLDHMALEALAKRVESLEHKVSGLVS